MSFAASIAVALDASGVAAAAAVALAAEAASPQFALAAAAPGVSGNQCCICCLKIGIICR